jgi:SAM-dependent methyltransferase
MEDMVIMMSHPHHPEPHESRIVEVYRKVDDHRRIADMIRRHSTNPEDIRALALDTLGLTDARDILELGCGFGSFTGNLKGRLHADAVITGLDIIAAYEPSFLDTCRRSGIHSRFFANGITQMDTFADASYDLVLCSYALYFFPHAVRCIARILRPTGTFIAITHDRNNMEELIVLTKEILLKNDLLTEERLPVETIIDRFSGETGSTILKPWFGSVRSIDYRNALIFSRGDIDCILDYFRFKSPLFLTGTTYHSEKIISLLSWQLKRSSLRRQGLKMSKDDRIFICTSPLRDRRKP